MDDQARDEEHHDNDHIVTVPLLNANGLGPTTQQTFTVRASVIGLIIGTMICLSNVYFGLQNGFSSTMALPSSVLGFGFFRIFKSRLQQPFTPQENAFIQTVAGAVGAMPKTAGLVSVIPALEYLLQPSEGGPLSFTWMSLVLWSLGLSFFGVIFAIFLRHQFLYKESLPFPSATASAIVIKALHNPPTSDDESERSESSQLLPSQPSRDLSKDSGVASTHVFNMIAAFIVSGILTILALFLPILHDIPLFGSSMAKNWLWTLNLSPGVFGQGMITGPVISLHMLAGTVVGWGILSPIVKHNGWVSGEVGDWTMGSRGWILWIALSSLIVDCLVNLLWMAANLESVRGVFTSSWTWTRSILGRYKTSAQILQPYRIDEYDAQTAHGRTPSVDSAVTEVPDVRLRDSQTPRSERILPDTTPSIRTLGLGLIGASVLCIATTTFVFNNVVPIATIPLAIVFTSLLSVMSIRAYGQTDYTPVDGLGKISQYAFALVVSKSNPQKFIINLAVGAIAEAGAMQAADVIFDLKTGLMVGADVNGQLIGHIIGSVFGAFVSACFYKLYTKMYPVPGPLFPVPAAYLWISAARLVYGAGLPRHAGTFSLIFGIVFAVTTALKLLCPGSWWNPFLPDGVAFAVGMYNAPSFTLPRVLGGLALWLGHSKLRMNANSLRLIAAGLILGESIFSLLGLLFFR